MSYEIGVNGSMNGKQCLITPTGGIQKFVDRHS